MARQLKRMNKEETEFIVQGLYDGDRNVDILDKFEEKFGRRIDDQTIGYHRKKHADDLADHEKEAVKYNKQIGFSRMSNRIKLLEKMIRKIAEEWDKDEDYDKKHSQLITDLQKVMAMMTQCLGENITNTSIQTPGGTTIEVKVIDIPVISEDDPLNGD